MTPLRTIFRLLLLPFALAALVGVRPGFAQGDFFSRAWTTDDGLPHNSVSQWLQDANGFLWFATVGGLARFDGREFREFRPPSEYHLNGYNIRSFAEERPGTLVVLPAGDTVLRLEGRRWSVHPLTPLLASLKESPADLEVDAAGDVWVTTFSGHMVRWAPDGTHKFYNTDSIARRPRDIGVVPDQSGGVWICADLLWFADRNGELSRAPLTPTESGLIGPGQSGRLWLWSDQRLIQLEHGAVVKEYKVSFQENVGRLRRLFEDRSGAVWIATSRGGLYRFADDRLSRVPSYSYTQYVGEDREGNIWVATDGAGVIQLREKSYRLINAASGLPHDLVSSISEDPTGQIWLANRGGGVAKIGLDGIPQPSGLVGSRAFANVVCADAQSRIWFGGGRNGLFRWTPNSAPEQMPSPAADLHLLFRAENGDIWYTGASNDLGYYHGDELHAFSAAELGATTEIRAIAQDRSGGIWLGGRNGILSRWDGHAFERFPLPEELSRVLIHSIHVDDSDRVWFASPNGLGVKEGDRISLLNETNGLPDNIIHQIVEDSEGYLWLAARRGFFYIAKSDLLAAARDPKFRIESFRLGPSQGLVGVTVGMNFSPAACRARDGRLWFAAAQGALVIDPSRLPHDLPAPNVFIDEIKIDGTVLPSTGEARFRSGRHRVEFRFVALSYTSPEEVVLRHQLEGADPQWIDTASDRSASYTNLPPGKYRLRVIARNSAGTWNRDGATLNIIVVPAWWETAAFRYGAIALLIALAAIIARAVAHRRVQRRLQELEHQHAVEKERMRIARDLHDDLGAGLTEVTLLADRLAEEAPNGYGSEISRLAGRARRLAAELSGIIWTMNANHSSLDEFAKFVRRYAERFFRNTGTRCSVHGVETIPAAPLAPAVQHQLLAITKEALNNILKHARASEAWIELRYIGSTFELRIRDNGAGFDLNAVDETGGNGVRNIRSRAKELNAVLELTSAPGAGTQIILRAHCPMPHPYV